MVDLTDCCSHWSAMKMVVIADWFLLIINSIIGVEIGVIHSLVGIRIVSWRSSWNFIGHWTRTTIVVVIVEIRVCYPRIIIQYSIPDWYRTPSILTPTFISMIFVIVPSVGRSIYGSLPIVVSSAW